MTDSRVDPRTLGALCDECPLSSRTPVVPGQVSKPARHHIAFVSEYPGEVEEQQNRFLVGPTGDLLRQRLLKLPKGSGYIAYRDLHVSNALLCRTGRKLKPAEFKKAVACCRPRLSRELEMVEPSVVIAAGKQALLALTGHAKIGDWVGAPLPGADFYVGGRKKGTCVADFTGLTILPIFQPAMLFRDKMDYIPVMRTWLQRAAHIASGRLKPWKWPTMHIDKTDAAATALRRIIDKGRPVSVDIETLGVDPWTVDITCIGVAGSAGCVSIPWDDYKGVQGVVARRTKLDRQLYTLMLELLTSDVPKVFQNGIFDRMCLRTRGIMVGGELFDTLTAHMVVAPRLPHKLAFQCAVEFHAPRWKEAFRGAGGTKEFEK